MGSCADFFRSLLPTYVRPPLEVIAGIVERVSVVSVGVGQSQVKILLEGQRKVYSVPLSWTLDSPHFELTKVGDEVTLRVETEGGEVKVWGAVNETLRSRL